jgi:protein-tyrosine-phosphatase
MTTSPRTVLFVCLHGAAKSVLAAADCARLARERGLDLAADSAGTEPDPEIAPAVARRLREEGVDPGDRRPRLVTREDLAGAWKVVAFGCDLSGLAAAGCAVEQWHDVPAVSEGLDRARAVIQGRLEPLLAEAAAENGQTRNIRTNRRPA